MAMKKPVATKTPAITAERIIRHWDGGERLIATGLAKEASADEVSKAVEVRPDLQGYIAGNPA